MTTLEEEEMWLNDLAEGLRLHQVDDKFKREVTITTLKWFKAEDTLEEDNAPLHPEEPGQSDDTSKEEMGTLHQPGQTGDGWEEGEIIPQGLKKKEEEKRTLHEPGLAGDGWEGG